jgi:hypothetical protein
MNKSGLMRRTSEVVIAREGNRPTDADSRIPNTQTIVGFSPTKLSKNETNASAHIFCVDNASAWQRAILASANNVSTLALKIF